jgi:hypothetical protein
MHPKVLTLVVVVALLHSIGAVAETHNLSVDDVLNESAYGASMLTDNGVVVFEKMPPYGASPNAYMSSNQSRRGQGRILYWRASTGWSCPDFVDRLSS